MTSFSGLRTAFKELALQTQVSESTERDQIIGVSACCPVVAFLLLVLLQVALAGNPTAATAANPLIPTTTSLIQSSPTLVSITVTPANQTLILGGNTQQYTALSNYSYNSTSDITSS